MRLDDNLLPHLMHGPGGAAAAAWLPFAATMVQGGAQAYSARAASRQQKRTARHNAWVAEEQALDARRRGVERVKRYRQRLRALLGRQRAVQSSAGADIGAGSPVQLQVAQEMLGELDARVIQVNAEREAWGYEAMGPQFAFAQEAARIEAFGTQVGAVGQAVGAYATYRANK